MGQFAMETPVVSNPNFASAPTKSASVIVGVTDALPPRGGFVGVVPDATSSCTRVCAHEQHDPAHDWQASEQHAGRQHAGRAIFASAPQSRPLNSQSRPAASRLFRLTCVNRGSGMHGMHGTCLWGRLGRLGARVGMGCAHICRLVLASPSELRSPA